MASPDGPSTDPKQQQQDPASGHQASASDAGPADGGGLDYQALYEQCKDRPCRVARLVKVHEERGEQLRTKQRLIDAALEPVHAAESLEQVHRALEDAGQALAQLGVFSDVDMLVNEEPMDEPDQCSVLVDLKEKNWYKAHAATYFQGGENTMEVGCGLHNATGHAEHVTFTAEYGTQQSSHFTLAYEQPQPWGLPISVEARVQQFMKNHVRTSSFSEQLRGLLLGCRSLSGRHSLQYELGWRSLLVDVTKTGASPSVAAQAGDSLKGAARYTLFLDQRSNPVNPSSGWAIRSVSEVAGLSPDQSLRYVRQQLDGQVLLPMTSYATLSLSASTGILLPWGGQHPLSRTTCIADRFFLGGPASLRGFKYQGVGPSDERRWSRASSSGAAGGDAGAPAAGPQRDMLGGDLYASVLAQVLFALPHRTLRALNLQGHVFVNGGNVDQLSGPGLRLEERLRHWASNWRWSAGVGVVLPTWAGRFEANYVHVISAQEHDRVKRGIQLGFATSIFSS